jgi:hypothetical protein
MHSVAAARMAPFVERRSVVTPAHPSLKPAGGSKATAEASSRNAADEAVGLLLEMQNRQRSGKIVDAEFVAMVKGVNIGNDAALVPPSPIEMAIRRNPVILKAAVGAIVGLVLYGALFVMSPLWAGVPVRGKAWVKKSPAAGVELVFHAVPSLQEVGRVVVAKNGEFAAGLRRGSYKITARSTGKPALAGILAAPETTPLYITVDKPVSKLNLYLPH